MVRSGDDDRVNFVVKLLKHFSVIQVVFRSGINLGGHAETAFVNIAEGVEILRFHLGHRFTGLSPNADESQIQLLVGVGGLAKRGDRDRPGLKSGRGGNRAQSTRAQKITAGKIHENSP